MEFLYKCNNILQSLFILVISRHNLMSQDAKIAMFHLRFIFFSNLSSTLFALDSSGKPAIPMKRSESGTRTCDDTDLS
jgi:hypothetical protein